MVDRRDGQRGWPKLWGFAVMLLLLALIVVLFMAYDYWSERHWLTLEPSGAAPAGASLPDRAAELQ